MEFKLIDFLPENWLNALGTTLFHSLWMGVILAVFSGAVMFATRKASAKLRYNLLTVGLLLFVFAISAVFYAKLTELTDRSEVQLKDQVEISLRTLQNTRPTVSSVQFSLYAGLNKVFNIWNTYSSQIVLIWFLIICGKSIQLMMGLNGVYHLRKRQIYAAGKIWDEHLELLADKLGLNHQVKLMQSGIAKVPLVVGHFKPLILIPLGLLNGLSTAEVEAILAHELAHIKRRDYLVNILQSFIEIVFFFNPAVLWVSQLIKTEREHCCDDLAIACVNDRKNYVKALIFCQEFEQCAPAYAMGVTGKNGSLLHRASRMLLNTNSTLNKMEKTILTIALVSTVFCTAAFKGISHAATNGKGMITSSFLVQDTAKKNKSGEQLEKEIEQKMKAAERKNQSAKKADLGEAALKQDRIDAKQVERDAKQAADDARLAAEEKKYAESEKKYKAAEKKYAADEAKYAEDEKKYAEDEKRWAQDDKKRSQIPKPPKPPRPAKVSAPAMPAAPPTPPTPPRVSGSITANEGNTVNVQVENGKDNTDKISAELLKDGLISNTTNLSFSLDKNNLIVNGVKQSKGLHTKYKSRYLESENHSLSYVVNVTKTTKK